MEGKMRNYLTNNFAGSGDGNVSRKRKRKIKSLYCDTANASKKIVLKKKTKLDTRLNNSIQVQNNDKSNHFNENVNYIEVITKPYLLQTIPNTFLFHLTENKAIKSVNSFVYNIFDNIIIDSKNGRFTSISKSQKFLNIKEKKTFSEKYLINKSSKKNINDKEQKKINNNNDISKFNSIIKKKNTKIIPFLKSDSAICNTVSNKVSSYADFYEISDKNAFIFHLHHPCKFSFYGKLKITLIRGEIEILGFKLNKSSNLQTVVAFSPKFYIPLLIETKVLKEDIYSDAEMIKQNLKVFLSESKVQQLFKSLKPNDSILLIEKEASNLNVAIDKYVDLPLFPKDLENLSSVSESLKKLQSIFKFNPCEKEKQYRKSLEWEKIKLNRCSVICGGKGVGKSTLLKFFANNLISKNEKVLVLDLDPGQPEFTPPGFISAVIVEKPLLGPNFTHLTKGEVMLYFGDVDTAQSPSKYLKCVKYLINWCKNDIKLISMKWLVNTMGFCKGLGVEIMISVLKLLAPDTVIQIKSSINQNNYPFNLTQSIINNKKGFEMMSFEGNISFNHFIINSIPQSKNNFIKSELIPADFRNIIMISYFSKMLSSPYYNFNSVQPFVVPFCNIYLGTDYFLLPEEILKLFNGSIVSLLHFEHTNEIILTTSFESEKNFKIVFKPNATSSFGLGLIRGVDCVQKNFYILTPLPLEELNKVNCLSLGKINAPVFMYLKQETVKGPTLYTSFAKGHASEQVKRMFRPLTH